MNMFNVTLVFGKYGMPEGMALGVMAEQDRYRERATAVGDVCDGRRTIVPRPSHDDRRVLGAGEQII